MILEETFEEEEIDRDRGTRHRIKYRTENLYVSVFPFRCEVFISSVGQDQDPLTGAALDAFSRLTTLAWKHTTLDIVIDQLKKSSRSGKDLPGILASLLAEEF